MNSPDTAVQICRMTEADLDRVMEIARKLKELPSWTLVNYLAALDLDPNPDAAPRRIALAVEVGGKVMGLTVASLLPPQAELEIIAVDAQFQRRGLARKLFAELAGKLQLAGVTEVDLEVRASNQPALGLYRRLGFKENGRRQRYYHDPIEDAVLMRLGLEGYEPVANTAQIP